MFVETRAFARAGLVGNPSDGYFGKTISVCVRNFGASILLYQSPELVFEAQEADSNTYRSPHHLLDQVQLTGYNGGIPLLKATVKRFVQFCTVEGLKLDNKNFTVRYSSTIPRQVGLAGSSAIVTAMLKALCQFYEVSIPQHLLPSLVLVVETEEMGITAGLQDRVIQAYEGCVFMDFEKEHLTKNGFGKYEPLPVQNVPPLYIAYKTQLGKVSGKVLNTIRSRYEAGDELTINTLKQIADVAQQGREAILQKNYVMLGELINKNFDLRTQIMAITDSNYELINAARNSGATSSFTGSGGSIIGTYPNDRVLERLVVEMKKINARVIKPIIG